MADPALRIAAMLALCAASCVQAPPRPPVLPPIHDADADVADVADVAGDVGPEDGEESESGADTEIGTVVLDGGDAVGADGDGDATDVGSEVDAPAPECVIAGDCAPPTACHGVATCDQSTGKCSYPNLVGTPCEDGDICTDAGTCADGVCVSPAKDCDDGIPCTEDSCDAQKGCRHDISKCTCTKDEDCDDGDLCTLPASCKSLTCAGGEPVDCSTLDAPCTVGQCDSLDGSCVSAPRADGAPCDDGDPCTGGDGCVAGACEPGGPACDDANPCTTDLCAATTGKCSNVPVQDGTSCDDADSCTIGDACNSGKCISVKRLEANIAWEATLTGADSPDVYLRLGVSDTGTTTLVVEADAPPTLTYAGGAESLTLGFNVDLGLDAVLIVRFDSFGAFKGETVIPADGFMSLVDAVHTPAGATFVLVKHAASLWFSGGRFRVTDTDAVGSTHTLLSYNTYGSFEWDLRFEPELTPLALFFSAGTPPRVGVFATHSAEVAGPTRLAPALAPLPASAQSTSSLAMLSWTLPGTAVVSRDVGSLTAGSWSRGVARGGADLTVATMLVGDYSMVLNGIGELPGGTKRAMLARFGADGSTLSTVNADSPILISLGSLDYDSTHGSVASVAYQGLLNTTDSAGTSVTIVGDEVGPDLGLSCYLRVDTAGNVSWPLNCGAPGGGIAANIDSDGSVFVLALGAVAEAPAGGRFRLSALGENPLFFYAARLSPTGHFVGIAPLDITDVCTVVASNTAGYRSLGCLDPSTIWSPPLKMVIRSVETEPAPGCEP